MYTTKCKALEKIRQEKETEDDENKAKEEGDAEKKLGMDLAAKYIQKKWNWYQTEGKHLAKKRKKGKKGKKKKK